MKKVLLFLFAVTCSVHYGLSQVGSVAPGKFLITGQLANVPDSTNITLYRPDGQLLLVVGQSVVVNGTFSFSDTIRCVKKLMLTSRDKGFPNNLLNVWVAPGKHTTIAGKDKMLRLWDIKSDIPEQLSDNSYTNCALEIWKELLKLSVDESDLLKQLFVKEHADDENYSKQIWEKVNAIRKIFFPLQTDIYKKELDYMQTAPIDRVWMERLFEYSQLNKMSKTFMPYTDELKELYAKLPEAMKQTSDAQLVYQFLYPEAVVAIGDEMVDGDLYDTKGTVHRLSEFKGKYILLDFWSLGCGPCIKSIPELDDITETYKDNLAVISISIDPEKAWKEFIDKKKMTGNQWNELRRVGTGLTARYQVKGYPHYVLIAPDGKVQDVWGGYGKGSLLEKMKDNLNSK